MIFPIPDVRAGLKGGQVLDDIQILYVKGGSIKGNPSESETIEGLNVCRLPLLRLDILQQCIVR